MPFPGWQAIATPYQIAHCLRAIAYLIGTTAALSATKLPVITPLGKRLKLLGSVALLFVNLASLPGNCQLKLT
ncbi:MAG: hypothetical protein SFT94_11835 [Pseudanabaenaceae cyanobacterium bins.68]|nr:hypothetical protein [Pseudanabaenaceae cyanobacterium bins.68]